MLQQITICFKQFQMVALGEMWRNLSPEEKLVYNNQAKLGFQVKKTSSLEEDDIKIPDKGKKSEGEDNVEKIDKQKVESESDSNEEISDSSEDPENVN